MGVIGQLQAPAALPPRNKTRCLLYSRQGEPQGQSGRFAESLSPSPGFDPRTVQPVESRYTDWAISAHSINVGLKFTGLELWSRSVCWKTDLILQTFFF